MNAQEKPNTARTRAYYSPSFGLTTYRCGYWSRDGMFYSTGPERKTREEAERDAQRS